MAISSTFNPYAGDFIITAKEEHRHSGQRNGYSLGRGEAGHCMGKQTPRQRGRECRSWDGLGRLKPVLGNEGTTRRRNRQPTILQLSTNAETKG